MSFMSQPWLVSSTIEKLATETQQEKEDGRPLNASLPFHYPRHPLSSYRKTKDALRDDLRFTYPYLSAYSSLKP